MRVCEALVETTSDVRSRQSRSTGESRLIITAKIPYNTTAARTHIDAEGRGWNPVRLPPQRRIWGPATVQVLRVWSCCTHVQMRSRLRSLHVAFAYIPDRTSPSSCVCSAFCTPSEPLSRLCSARSTTSLDFQVQHNPRSANSTSARYVPSILQAWRAVSVQAPHLRCVTSRGCL